MDSRLIGKRIKLLLIIKNIKRSELAEKLGISYNTCTKEINGQREFCINEIIKIIEIFNIDIELSANIFFNDNFFIQLNEEKFLQ